VTKENAHRCLFVTDDRHPSDLVVEGHMDHVLRKAIALGLDPVTAIQMATLNPARYFLLHNHGAIAPGYYADLVAFDSLERIEAQQVWKNGRLVAEGGRATWSPTERPRMPLRGSVNIRWLEGGEFDIPARPGRIRVIEVTEGQIVTGSALEEPKVEGGFVVADPSRDLAKLVVVERHRASGRMGFGFVRGFGLREGALASTIAHDSHNLICLGVDDESIRAAVVHLNKMSGGVVVARGGRIVGELPLPVAGLMTQRPLEAVHEARARLIALAHEQGVRLADPFMTLSFLALPVVPSLKLTDRGLVDVGAFAHVDLFVE
jgi:adenine deaminase